MREQLTSEVEPAQAALVRDKSESSGPEVSVTTESTEHLRSWDVYETDTSCSWIKSDKSADSSHPDHSTRVLGIESARLSGRGAMVPISIQSIIRSPFQIDTESALGWPARETHAVLVKLTDREEVVLSVGSTGREPGKRSRFGFELIQDCLRRKPYGTLLVFQQFRNRVTGWRVRVPRITPVRLMTAPRNGSMG